MSIQEQLQIVEDNLNEYGQCNITLEEFNYIKMQIRADMIDECIKLIVNTPSKIGTHLKEPQKVDTCLTMLADRQIEIIDILNQLKEKK